MDFLGQVLRSGTFWSAVTAIATILAAMGIFLARKQIRFDAWLKANEIFTDPKFVAQRGRVFARLDAPTREWTEEEREEGLNVCRKMDEFAGLAPYLTEKTVLRQWGDPLGKAWRVLAPLVEEERVKSAWPKKWEAFEGVGKKALKENPNLRNVGDRIPSMRLAWTFVCAVARHWGSLVTGGFIIALLTVWQGTGHRVPPSVYWGIALFALIISSFRAWDQERKIKERALVAISTPRDWAGDWKELASNFRAEVGKGITAAYQKHTTLGESWHLSGDRDGVDRVEALCKHARDLLAASPKVAKALSAKLLQLPARDRWLCNLKDETMAFVSNGHGVETLGSGEKAFILLGSVRDLPAVSPNICVEYAGKEY